MILLAFVCLKFSVSHCFFVHQLFISCYSCLPVVLQIKPHISGTTHSCSCLTHCVTEWTSSSTRCFWLEMFLSNVLSLLSPLHHPILLSLFIFTIGIFLFTYTTDPLCAFLGYFNFYFTTFNPSSNIKLYSSLLSLHLQFLLYRFRYIVIQFNFTCLPLLLV